MRFSSISVVLGLLVSAIGLAACAEKHSARELAAAAAEASARDDRWDDEDEDEAPPPALVPLDAGPHRVRDTVRDAGRMRPSPSDAGVTDAGDSSARDARVDASDRDSGRRDGSVNDASADASLPAWQVPDAATIDVSVVATCEPPPAPAPTPDPSCRASGWHTPPCYRAPVDCPALSESAYCAGFNEAGDLLFVGMDRGTSCRVRQDPMYPQGPGSNSFALIGGDLYSIDSGVILKRSIADGSFDIAPVQAWTIFGMDNALAIQALDGVIRRYPSWDALKSDAMGENLASASTGGNGAFGGTSSTIAAAWPDGALYLLGAGDARQRMLRLQGHSRAESGSIHGLDLMDDGRVFVSSDGGLSTYNSQDGRLISRFRMPPLFGLSCEPGLLAGTPTPVLNGTPRPGYYSVPERSDLILSSSDCAGPFNGPRYVGEKSGPELLVIGTFFDGANTVRDERSTPHILVLTTVEPTQWSVTVAPGANVERIIVNGSASQVTVQSPTPIPLETLYDASSLGMHHGDWPAADESALRAALEQRTSRRVSEIMGCHFASSYVVRNVPPLCAAPDSAPSPSP